MDVVLPPTETHKVALLQSAKKCAILIPQFEMLRPGVPGGLKMETQTTVLYEIVDSVTNESFVTLEHYEALACYKAGDMVFERHRSITNPSEDTQTIVIVSLRWTNIPEFQED